MGEDSSTVSDYMVALGMVVVSSAAMEGCLREAFCSLVGSKFAAIVAGGQAVTWLIDQCEALTDAHRELPGASTKAIREALRHCREANGRRNELVHGLKASGEMGLETIRSRKNTHVLISKEWGLSEIRTLNQALVVAANDVRSAVMTAFGPEAVDIGEMLRREDCMGQQDA